MALIPLQRDVCRLLADNRIASGESYVAGGVALNELLGASRLSHDIDTFHDTEEALAATWASDRKLLTDRGFGVDVLRERPTFVEAHVKRGGDAVLLQWARDSAYRFFPLVEQADLGLVLHPFDLATNKVLALVGRLEVRDWVDVILCDERIQPLGYLAWAACGKDPGFSPSLIIELAAQSSRYTAADVASLAFEGDPPDLGALSRLWHQQLAAARKIVALLPADHAGECVLLRSGDLCRAPEAELPRLIAAGALAFHPGRIKGALPQVIG